MSRHTYVSEINQDGRVVKALDLSSNGRMSAWVRTPLLVCYFLPQPCYLEALIISRFIMVQLQSCTPGNPEHNT